MASVPDNIHPLTLRYWYDGDYHAHPDQKLAVDRAKRDINSYQDHMLDKNNMNVTQNKIIVNYRKL